MKFYIRIAAINKSFDAHPLRYIPVTIYGNVQYIKGKCLKIEILPLISVY